MSKLNTISKYSNLYIQGYASVFNIVDLDGDIILPIAFVKSLQKLENIRLPLLWGHDCNKPIGQIINMHIDDYGLYIEAIIIQSICREMQIPIDAIAMGIINGLSIGYINQDDLEIAPEDVTLYDNIEQNFVPEEDILQMDESLINNIRSVTNKTDLRRSISKDSSHSSNLSISSDEVRWIQNANLLEISVVTVPSNAHARIQGVFFIKDNANHRRISI